jgi:hypothetical protein
MASKDKEARVRDRESFDEEISRIIEGGGYTPEERIQCCLETIDLSLARARNASRTGEAKGSLAFASLAERIQVILSNIEDRQADFSGVNKGVFEIRFADYSNLDGPKI